jgi:hypothetical protein
MQIFVCRFSTLKILLNKVKYLRLPPGPKKQNHICLKYTSNKLKTIPNHFEHFFIVFLIFLACCFKSRITVIYSRVVVSAFLGFVYLLTYPFLLIRSAFFNQLFWYVFVLAVARIVVILL